MRSHRIRSGPAGAVCAVTIVLVAAVWSAAAQKLSLAEAPAFRADSTLVLVPVAVVDRRGAVVNGLARDAFTLAEDGVRQQIRTFSEEDAASMCPVKRPTTGTYVDALGLADVYTQLTSSFPSSVRDDDVGAPNIPIRSDFVVTPFWILPIDV